MDCGLEVQEMLASLHDRPNTDLILKYNRGRESSTKWLELAKEKGELIREDVKKGYRMFRGSTCRRLRNREEQIRLVFDVKETYKEKGQLLFLPKVEVFSVWTSLRVFSNKGILRLSRMRGTSGQFHAAFKTEMDMERLPSGKFKVNRAFLRMLATEDGPMKMLINRQWQGLTEPNYGFTKINKIKCLYEIFAVT